MTRGQEVLLEVWSNLEEQLTAMELAYAVDRPVASVRRDLVKMTRKGLIVRDRERKGPGPYRYKAGAKS